jgi:pectin methylesterase-like acyl-CoA thioesterase
MTSVEDFTAALTAAFRAAMGDSNDEEIDAWRDTAEIAAELLGVDFNGVSASVDAALAELDT